MVYNYKLKINCLPPFITGSHLSILYGILRQYSAVPESCSSLGVKYQCIL